MPKIDLTKFRTKSVVDTESILQWNTMDGFTLSVEEMDTGHLFNSLKMLYNHFAREYGLETVWFKQRYYDIAYQVHHLPEVTLQTMLAMGTELVKRKDFPEKYEFPMSVIVQNLTKKRIKRIIR